MEILQSAPPKKHFVRGISYITGYHIVATNGSPDQPGCFMTYITQADPKGTCPTSCVFASGFKIYQAVHQCIPVNCCDSFGLKSAVVSSQLYAFYSASWSNCKPRSDFINGHASTPWFMVFCYQYYLM